MDELAKKRAEKSGDCRLWTAIDALEDTIADIKSGKISPEQLCIHMLCKDPSTGAIEHKQALAGVNTVEHIALLNLALRVAMDDWMGIVWEEK